MNARICAPLAMLMLLPAFAASASAAERQVYGLYNQFVRLNAKAEAMGARRGVADDSTVLCKHYQGITRLQNAGTPYFVVSRSGNNTWTCFWEGDDPGELVVVRMSSRDTDGERLRSNKLQLNKRLNDSPPNSSDKAVVSIQLDGVSTDGYGNTWPGWCHPGGMHVIDDVLIVPVEHNYSTGTEDDGGILLIDVSAPESPRLIKTIDMGMKVGVVGVTREPDGRYLFVMGGAAWAENAAYFVKSVGTTLDENFAFDYSTAYTWYSDADPDSGDNTAWDQDGWQTLNFVRDVDGSLGLITMSDSDDVEIGIGRTRLWYVNQNGNTIDLDLWASRDLGMKEPTTGDMDAGSGVYVTPTNQLLLYVCEHLSDGAEDSIRMGEFRTWDMRWPSDAGCTGWITLYETTNGWSNRDSQSYVIDWADYYLEEWDDLRDFEDFAGDTSGFSDEAESVRWNIAPGRYAYLYKDEDFTGDAYFLDGTGSAMAVGNLSSSGFADEVTSVRFLNREANMYVSTVSNGCWIAGGFGTSWCPYVGTTSVQYAADRIGAPPCFTAQTIYIGGGTYNQEVYIDRAMTLSVWNAGPVTIVGQ